MKNGEKQVKKPTNIELTKRNNKLEAENKALQEYIAKSVILIPRDENTTDFYNEQNGIKITITANHAVVISASSVRVFPNSTMVYPWLFTYVDLMLNKETEYDSDKKETIIENVQRFLYLLFDTDNNLTNPASMVLDWAYWLAKNTSLLENKGKEVRMNEVTTDVIKGMISELIIAKNGITIDSDKATEILNEVKKRIDYFILPRPEHNKMKESSEEFAIRRIEEMQKAGDGLAKYLDDNSCKFNDAIVIEASEITEAEALAEMVFNEQSKEEIAE